MRVRAGWAVTVLVIAALEFAASYRGLAVPVVLVLACVLPFALVALARRAGLGANAGALAVIVAAAAGGWLALRGSGSVTDAVPRLLTTARPAAGSVELLTPALLLVALVATLVAACVLAGDDVVTPGVSSPGLLAPVAGAAVLYVAAQLLAAGEGDPYGLVAVSLLVVVAAGWSHPYLRGGTSLAWRPAAAVPVLLVGLLSLGAAAVTSTAAAFDPRRHVTPPTVRLTEASPLTQLRTWTANPKVRILRAKVSGTDRLHLATLDRFTGADWAVDSRYQELGLVATGDLPAAERRTPVRATVRLERLGGVWLPAPGRPAGASLDGVLTDPDDGTLAAPGRVRPGLTYDVQGQRDAPTDDQVAVAAVPTTLPAHYLDLPNGPVAFAQYARAAVRGASTPLEEAIALESAVRTDRRLDPRAPTGSSYGRLSTFLFAPAGTAGAGVGSAEQFAAAFAVLAREVGLPSRLTVGFDLGKPGRDGSVLVRGADATVWPEVYLGGAGWVPFAPTPGADAGGGDGRLRDDVLARLSERVKNLPPVQPPATKAPTPTPTPVTSGAPADTAAAPHRDASTPGWVVALIGVVVVLLVAVLLLGALRAIRTRRHRRSGARGAWAEVVDLLVLLGRRPAAHRPAPEVAADARDVLGEHAAVIAAEADRAAFSPAHTAQREVWKDVVRVRRRARSTVPGYRRVLLPLDPRPLVPRRR